MRVAGGTSYAPQGVPRDLHKQHERPRKVLRWDSKALPATPEYPQESFIVCAKNSEEAPNFS